MSWSLAGEGLPWLATAAATAAAIGVLVRLRRPELAPLPTARRRVLGGLRLIAVALAGALAAGPVLVWRGERLDAPEVAILVDCSGSMAQRDHASSLGSRLDAAVALGLLAPGDRPMAASLAADSCERLATTPEARQATTLRRLAADLGGMDDLESRLRSLAEEAARPHADLARLAPRARELAGRLRTAQAAADRALVAGAAAGSAVARALAASESLDRAGLARGLVSRTVLPALGDRARVTLHAFAADLVPAASPDTLPIPVGTTDAGAALTQLAREWTPGAAGGVVLVSDGRWTAGGDPLPAARAVAGRGMPLVALTVGDAGLAGDPAVAELTADAEVEAGSRLDLTARIRLPKRSVGWDLVLLRDGTEVERRPMRGNGEWQRVRLSAPVGPPGLRLWRAELVRRASRSGGLWREVWTGVPGTMLADLTSSQAFAGPANEEQLSPADHRDTRTDYGERLRGWIMPPEDGPYRFWIAGDDACELRLAPDGLPEHARPVAQVPAWVAWRAYDANPVQRSGPVQLVAGQRCWIEVLHKQGSGDGHLSLGWELPSGVRERPLPPTRLLPWTPGQEEDPLPGNNRAERAVAVRAAGLRVLLVDAQPRWESRHLAAALDGESRTSVTVRWRASATDGALPGDAAALEPYDAVVLGDLLPVELDAAGQARLVEYVTRHGGLLAVVSGPRGMPADFGLGALADLLPVRIASPRVGAPLRLRAVAGADATLLRLTGDAQRDLRLWSELPVLPWRLAGIELAPGGEAVLVADGPQASPLLATARRGAGRVVWLGTDQTWRWRATLGERQHAGWWRRVLGWGSEGRPAGADPRLLLGLDHAVVPPGGAVTALVRARDDSLAPERNPPTMVAVPLDAGGEEIATDAVPLALQRADDGDGLWLAPLPPLAEGRWRVRAVHGRRPWLSEARDLAVRGEPDRETAEAAADPEAMRRLAEAGGGWSAGVGGARAAIDRLAEGLHARPVPVERTLRLWNHPLALALLALLLLGEWLLRKRWGMP